MAPAWWEHSLTSSDFPRGYRLTPRAACPQTLNVRTRLSGEAGNAQVPPWIASLSELSAGRENAPPADPFTAPKEVPQLPRASLTFSNLTETGKPYKHGSRFACLMKSLAL